MNEVLWLLNLVLKVVEQGIM